MSKGNMENNHFKQFASDLEALLAGYATPEKSEFTQHQKSLVDGLVRLESSFRRALIKHRYGPAAYKNFVNFIMDIRRNILAARPYFRERQSVFKEEISPILRKRRFKSLYKFNINYSFISFVLKQRKFGPNSDVRKFARAIETARKEIIERNMPLAISRARLFKRSTPRSHLEYMDLIQISNEGLIAAVDKFVLPYSPVFRAVIIGRASGNMIEQFSETLLHFYPSDKRKIYKAHKIQGRNNGVSAEVIAEGVNANSDTIHKTNEIEIGQLLSAASHVSIDSPAPDNNNVINDEHDNPIDKYEADASTRPDNQFENLEVKKVLYDSIDKLSIFEQKFLSMKGIVNDQDYQ